MRKRGFSMVEVIIVVAIIAVLASIIIPKMTQNRERAKLENCKGNLRHIMIAATLYSNEHNGTMPPVANISETHALVTEGYLKAKPVCPGNSPTGNSYYFAYSTSYGGENYARCINTDSLCHPALPLSRPAFFWKRGYLYE